MNSRYLLIVLAPFSVVSALALWQHGYWGIWQPHFQSWGAGQVLLDLVIALSLVMVWLWRDSRQLGRNPWAWLVLTLVAGSFGPLLYLLTRAPLLKRDQGACLPNAAYK